ncbi:MAG: ATP-binding domain-containing protein [Chloroflexaceae bacterium]|nr:ATP-binding domain-containing protein [Chloroflexaceae bacterium]
MYLWHPDAGFHTNGHGPLALAQVDIDRLYAAVDTQARAEQLMADRGLSFDHPHYRPKGTVRGSTNRLVVHLSMFGGSRPSAASPWFAHRVWLNTSDKLLEQQVQRTMSTRVGRKDTWRVERHFVQVQPAEMLARELYNVAGAVDIARWAMLTDRRKFAFQPASQLCPTMLVPVWRDGAIVEEEIVSVERVDYDGPVYDLDIANVHNYVANQIVVHNSVYAWRGADIRNILQFEDDYPDAQVVLLEQNYRSTQAILDTAQAIIRGARRKHDKQLWTQNGSGVQATLIEGYDQNDEAQRVADEITHLMAREGYRPGDFAVMYRTNAQSRAVEEALMARHLPYYIVGGTRFYERKEVKDVLAYLRVVCNPADSVSMERIINVPKRSIGERTVADLQRWAAELGMSVYHALRELQSEPDAGPFTPRTTKVLLSFLTLIDGLIAEHRVRPLVELLDVIVERTDFKAALEREYGSDEGEDRWNNVLELYTVAADYMHVPLENQLTAYLEEIALVADVDSLDQRNDAVTCITLHQAKGLEYPVVFLIGLEEGILPHSRSSDERDKLDEERRLLYVGATRARERLYLLHAFKRTSYGRTNLGIPSRFLADIPRDLLRQPSKRDAKSLVQAQTRMFTDRSTYSTTGRARGEGRMARGGAAGEKTAFIPGQRVMHSTFGEGVVVSSKLVDGDEEVVVNFVSKGEKRLLASFARLKAIS